MEIIKINSLNEIPKNFTGIIEYGDIPDLNKNWTGYNIKWTGSKHWYLNGKFHREDGPAKEFLDGSKFWYLNGKLHRRMGPAAEISIGSKFWYLNGRLTSPQEVFDQLTEEEKEEVIWNLDEWK